MAEYEPLIIERAEGCMLVDVQGRRYLDGVSSLWCNVHGHRHPRLDGALRDQIDKVAHTTLLGSSNLATVRLAKRLTEIAPAGLEHVFFSDSGASAVEVALKLAFQYWRQCATPRPGKTTYIAFDNAYHGDTIGSVSVGGVARFHETFRPLLFDVMRLPAPDRSRLPEDVPGEQACDHYLKQMERVLAEHHERVAAVVVEPLVQCAAGMLMQPAGYLRGVRELTKKYNVLLIADEVAVGVGRTGRMFACEHEEITPDLLCLAKGITGGYLPLAVTMATDEIWQAFLGAYAESRTFFHGHTYGGNALASAVALATLEVFEEEQTLAAMQPKIARIAEHLARIAKLPYVRDVRQCGFIVGIELTNEHTPRADGWEDRRGQQVCNHARRAGVLLRPLGNVCVIMPPLAISLEDLDRICLAVEAGIVAVMGAS